MFGFLCYGYESTSAFNAHGSANVDVFHFHFKQDCTRTLTKKEEVLRCLDVVVVALLVLSTFVARASSSQHSWLAPPLCSCSGGHEHGCAAWTSWLHLCSQCSWLALLKVDCATWTSWLHLHSQHSWLALLKVDHAEPPMLTHLWMRWVSNSPRSVVSFEIPFSRISLTASDTFLSEH
jgi:hypothetical protein